MNPFLRTPKVSLKSFFLGFTFGFLVTLILPEIGEANYAFQLGQVKWLKNAYAGMMGGVDDMCLALTIFSRNFSIALLIAIIPLVLICYTLSYRNRHPFKSGNPQQRSKKEIYFILTMYSIAILFAYGFHVFGLFLAYIFMESSFQGLLRWSLYFVPHGILETLGMVLAASTSIAIRDYWVSNLNRSFTNLWKEIPHRSYVNYLFILLIIFLSSAFLEVYVSRRFMEFVSVIM